MISTLPGQLNDLVRKLNEVQLNNTTTSQLIQAAVSEGTTVVQNCCAKIFWAGERVDVQSYRWNYQFLQRDF